jgi:phage gp29-like protein
MAEEWGPDKTPDGDRNTVERIESGEGETEHFATRARANDFLRLLRTLPDPDPVLRKMGKGITALKGLLSDSHLESVWSVRCSSASGAEWFISPGADGAKEKEAAEVFQAELTLIDIPRVIEEMLDGVAYGYSPIEIIWIPDNGRWAVGDLVGKPPEWFEYNQDNQLVFRAGVVNQEPLPPNRFLVFRNRPSYANPYGVKLFSKCFWPCTFKKNGFRWWTVFVEKYGGAFLYGKYPSNASEQYKSELLKALENMVADAVAIAPEDSSITIESLANKGSVSTVHSGYIEAANKEMSKAVLGQTLTTDIGKTGSYAAAQTHNMVREDIAAMDRRRVCKAFNRLAAVWSFYNYGPDVVAPRFEFVKDEDLQGDRAERDAKLYTFGWRPKKSYFTTQYNMPEDDFDVAAASPSAQGSQGFSQTAPAHHDERNIFQRLAARFAQGKDDKNARNDDALMQEFAEKMKEAGQNEIDKIIEGYADALGMVDDYNDAAKALLAQAGKTNLDDFAHTVDEVRWAARGIGDRYAG